MAPDTLYETVCPNCSKGFELDGDRTEGTCPHCGARLRFMADEEPAAPAPEPKGPKRKQGSPKTGADAAPQTPLQERPPRIGEFRVECPACHQAFNVEASQERGACQHCSTELRFENEYAEVGIEFPVECPQCGKLHEVPIEATHGRCPACKAELVYENVRPALGLELPRTNGDGADVPAFEPAAPPPIGKAEPAPAPPTPKQSEKPAPPPQPAVEPNVAAAPAEAAPGLPLAQAPPEGVPIEVDCPSCKSKFGVQPDAKEGNCPHCNVPLAFVTEKEYQQLQIAEERKKEFQAKLAARRAKQKEKALGKQKQLEEKKKGPSPAPAPPPAPAISVSAAPTRPAPIPPKPTGAAEPKKEKAPSAPLAPIVAEPATIEIEAAAAPSAAPPEQKKPRFGFLRRGKTEASGAQAPVAVEIGETIAPARAPKPAKRALAVAPVDIDLEEIPVAAAAQPPKKGRTREDPVPEPVIEFVLAEAAAEAAPLPTQGKKGKPTTAAEPAAIEMEPISVDAAAANEPAPKKGLFARFRKAKHAGGAPAAIVEGGEIEMGEPTPTPKSRKNKKEPTPAPAVVEMGNVDFSSDVIPAAPAKPKKGKAAKAAVPGPATIEMGEVSLDAAPGALEAEISIDIGGAPAPTGKKGRKR